MTLYLKDLHTLYLYIEEDHGRNLAIFDVRNPARIKFRKLVSINAPAPFDFEQLAPHTILIRYRDGSGEAILNLSDAKKPLLQLTSDKPTETYIIPVSNERAKQTGEAVQDTATPRDYQIVAPNSQAPLITIKSVIQQRNDVGNETTYLLGATGLTVIRNIQGERNLAALAPPFTNTIETTRMSKAGGASNAASNLLQRLDVSSHAEQDD
jgi:hypothetical protein